MFLIALASSICSLAAGYLSAQVAQFAVSRAHYRRVYASNARWLAAYEMGLQEAALDRALASAHI